ncbi:hypothetical protein BKA62DRAFT_684379 [Auriculariales sp. MPI-PUGE-AT-0066]|nr:hypothetical protein BKA62DRAFT_684379 [Auriculariales sp. MPI-PUGE-AT-0066]
MSSNIPKPEPSSSQSVARPTTSLLSYPETQSPAPVAFTSVAAASSTPTINQHRLYIGNLSQTVDEFTLIQVFSKYGKISKLDYLFNKTGPLKGKPRGYAFVEYVDKEAAAKALVATHDKLVRGRKLSVTFANQAANHDALPLHRNTFRRPVNEAGKVTTLSLLKSSGKKTSTAAKIAAMEAKLKQMEAAEVVAPPPAHASLPAKPFGPLPPANAPGAASGAPMTSSERFAKFKASSSPPRR